MLIESAHRFRAPSAVDIHPVAERGQVAIEVTMQGVTWTVRLTRAELTGLIDDLQACGELAGWLDG